MKNKGNGGIVVIIILVAIVWLLPEYWKSNTTAVKIDIEPGKAEVNLAQAKLTDAQTAKTLQEVRRQNEMDNGLGINMLARIINGTGITDAERVASPVLGLLSGICSAPIIILVFILFIVSRKKR